jgi:hypothetical protein
LSWSYSEWIYNYLCNQCPSPLTLWVWIPLRWGIQYYVIKFVSDLWFSPVYSTNKNDRHDIIEILLFGHCVVCSSLIYRFWLPPFGIFWPLCCLFFFDLQILITSLWYLLAIVLFVLLWFTDSDYLPMNSGAQEG